MIRVPADTRDTIAAIAKEGDVTMGDVVAEKFANCNPMDAAARRERLKEILGVVPQRDPEFEARLRAAEEATKDGGTAAI